MKFIKNLIFLSFAVAILFPVGLHAQAEKPSDYLPADFHKNRRAALRELMPENSVAVFFANPVRNRANDVDYIYHQDPDFYYLTGYKEPHSVLLIYSDEQTAADGSKYDEKIFVQKRNPMAESWTGKRMGTEGVMNELGFEQAFNHDEFADAKLNFGSFNQVMFYGFENDVRDSRSDADLYDLIAQFKDKANYPDDFDPGRYKIYDLIKSTDIENQANVAQTIDRYLTFNATDDPKDPLVRYRSTEDADEKKLIINELPKSNLDAGTLDYLMGSLREIKTAEEVVLMRKTAAISAVGQREVMKAMHPDMSETEVQGIHEYVFKKYGSEYEGYPSIVGAGSNGCILHYIENLRPRLDQDLVLMDLGAEYHGYSADVTRTIPASGKFSPEQKAIYDIVYEAQEAAINTCKPGVPFSTPHITAKQIINEGLEKLGIIKKGAFHRYFPHGTCHYLGLDVHDKGNYGPLQPNMVITVEPGIYIPKGSDCDEKWWGIAVRIEDDILITETGFENLSVLAPRKSEDIEALMAEPSPLDDFVLPDLN